MQNRHHSEVMTEIYIKSIAPNDLSYTQEQFFNSQILANNEHGNAKNCGLRYIQRHKARCPHQHHYAYLEEVL